MNLYIYEYTQLYTYIEASRIPMGSTQREAHLYVVSPLAPATSFAKTFEYNFLAMQFTTRI